MSISDDVKGWLKIGGWIAGLLVGTAITWGTFRGGTEARVTAVEKTVDEHDTKLDALADHASRSETDMEWMKDTVKGYDEKQKVVLDAIRELKKP
ncbi:MAG: hypothetical protein V3W44_04210 [Dehalococcoidales bacterium]